MKLSFQPIAREDLKFTSNNTTLNITLAVSAPYKLKQSNQFGQFGCRIMDNDDPEFEREIYGSTPFEALEMALIHFRNYINTLLASQSGTLQYQDGTPYNPPNTINLYSKHLENPSQSLISAIQHRMDKHSD